MTISNSARCTGMWLYHQGSDLANNLMRDIKSIRALWNWLFLFLFTWVIVWLVLYHAETCGNTAIVTVGSIVTAIFTNYVWSSYFDKRLTGVVPGIIPATNGNGSTHIGAQGAQENQDNG